MRGWLLVVGALAGCRGFFDTPPVTPDAPTQADAPAVPVAYVQSAANSIVASTSVTISLPLAQQAGDTNILIVGWSSGLITSIHDTNNNTYKSASGAMQAGDGWTQQIYVATSIAGGSNTVNVSLDTQTYAHVGLVEYSGLGDVEQSTGAIGTASDMPSTSGLTTTHPHDLLVAALTSQNSIYTTNITSYTPRLSGPEYLIADDEVTTSGGYQATAPMKPQGDWVMQLVALTAQ